MGIAYDISPSWYFHGSYDFIKIGVDNDLPKIAYNTNVNMIKLGIGHRFK